MFFFCFAFHFFHFLCIQNPIIQGPLASVFCHSLSFYSFHYLFLFNSLRNQRNFLFPLIYLRMQHNLTYRCSITWEILRTLRPLFKILLEYSRFITVIQSWIFISDLYCFAFAVCFYLSYNQILVDYVGWWSRGINFMH